MNMETGMERMVPTTGGINMTKVIHPISRFMDG